MKDVIVTGAAGQLGEMFVRYLSENGLYKVYALDIDLSGVKALDNVVYKQVDITVENEVAEFFRWVGSVDILINNAGIGVFTPFEERTVDEFMSVVDVNLKGTFLMCREAIKLMKPVNAGKILNIASVYGVISSDPRIYGESGRNNSEVYSITKAGVIMLTKYLAAHYAPHNIMVNSISPGGILKDQSSYFIEKYQDRTPVGTLGHAENLIPALKFLISEENTYTTGHNILVDGGFSIW